MQTFLIPAAVRVEEVGVRRQEGHSGWRPLRLPHLWALERHAAARVRQDQQVGIELTEIQLWSWQESQISLYCIDLSPNLPYTTDEKLKLQFHDISHLYLFKLIFLTPLYKNDSSPSGNRTLVSRVTGGDTDHYTNEDYI